MLAKRACVAWAAVRVSGGERGQRRRRPTRSGAWRTAAQRHCLAHAASHLDLCQVNVERGLQRQHLVAYATQARQRKRCSSVHAEWRERTRTRVHKGLHH